MDRNSLAVGVVTDTISKAAEELLKAGIDRENVARGTFCAALHFVEPVLDVRGKGKFLRELARGLELATIRTEGAGSA